MEKFQGILLLPSAGGNIEHKVSVRVLIGRELPTIHSEEHVCGSSTDPVVPVDEWMIGNEMKKIGSGHTLQIPVQELPTKGRLWHVDGGLKKPMVTNAERPTESANLFLVDSDHFRQRQKRDFHRFTPQVCEVFSRIS